MLLPSSWKSLPHSTLSLYLMRWNALMKPSSIFRDPKRSKASRARDPVPASSFSGPPLRSVLKSLLFVDLQDWTNAPNKVLAMSYTMEELHASSFWQWRMSRFFLCFLAMDVENELIVSKHGIWNSFYFSAVDVKWQESGCEPSRGSQHRCKNINFVSLIIITNLFMCSRADKWLWSCNHEVSYHDI